MANDGYDILDTYLNFTQAGETEIPVEYFIWTGIAMIAAAVADRVWLDHRGKNIPNLYTLLIGDSASGKGHAITRMEEVISPIRFINAVEIRTSAPALLDMMSAVPVETDDEGRLIDSSKVFIITPELKDNIGAGGKAEDFISWATSIWEGQRPIPILETTRTSGIHILIDPCVNWIAGSNKQWLMESITVSAMQGGFFGRVACVQPANYDLNNRKWDVPKIKDYDKILKYLQKRMLDLTRVEGPFTLSTEANNFLRNWYMSRPVPDAESPVAPVWKRVPQMVNKLCMIYSLSASTDLIITLEHAKKAKDIVEELLHGVQNLLVYASVTPKTETMYKMSVLLKQSKILPKTYLLSQLGVTKDDFDLALKTLVEAKSAKLEKAGTGMMVKWIGM